MGAPDIVVQNGVSALSTHAPRQLDFRKWPFASFRCYATIRRLSEAKRLDCRVRDAANLKITRGCFGGEATTVIFPSSNFLADSMLPSIMASKIKSDAGEYCAITGSMAIEWQIAALAAAPRANGGQ